MMEIFYDWKGFDYFVPEIREELIVCDKDSESILFYCRFVEKTEIVIDEAIPNGNHHLVAGTYLVYFIQAFIMLMKLQKENIYYGNFKVENIMVTPTDKIVKIYDFSTSMVIKKDQNYIKGLAYKYSTEEVLDKVIHGESVTAKDLLKNDVNSLFTSFQVVLFELTERVRNSGNNEIIF